MVEKKDNKEKEKGTMSVAEAGHLGGEKVIEKYGPEHMAEIGRKGGEHSHGGHSSDKTDENSEHKNKGNSSNDEKRGLASADKETREKVAKKGGESSHKK